MMNIHLNLSEVFLNKTNLVGTKSAFGFSFYPQTVSLPQLVKHIRTGKAFTVGCFKDNHRIEKQFVSSQLVALDLDQCPMTIDQLEAWSAFIQDYAFMMYPTPSSTVEQPKTRVLFILSEPVEQSSRWRVLQLALMEYFTDIKPDEACKDPARLFYGCQTASYYVNYEAVLPLHIIANLAILQAERDEFSRLAVQYTVRTRRTDTNVERCAANFLNHALKRVSQAGKGERHKTFRNYAQWLYGLNAGGWPISKAEIESSFTAISAAWGDKDNAAQGSLRWAEANCTAIDLDESKLTNRGVHVQNLKRQERYASGSHK